MCNMRKVRIVSFVVIVIFLLWYTISVNRTERGIIYDENTSISLFTNVSQCNDKEIVPRSEPRGNFWVLYNQVPAKKSFKCHASITYTTHTEYIFLDNLIPVVEKWQGPVSLAVYAPGDDFSNVLKSIAFLRECTTPLIKDLVTFHLYFDLKYTPIEIFERNITIRDINVNCSQTAPYLNVTSEETFRKQHNLLYPINVGRNVARESAQTFFVLPADIELYPSENVISSFLEMIATNSTYLQSKNPKVFPLSIFEVNADAEVPENKSVLKAMLENGTAHPFHENICSPCHQLPKATEWKEASETQNLQIFHCAKRKGAYSIWEPIFIGTHSDPLYDERLTWEGQRDKMTQGYAFCVMDYDFLILNNAFLVHRPGVKTYKENRKRLAITQQTNTLISNVIYPELVAKFGTKEGCTV